jgi:hypothetical protein
VQEIAMAGGGQLIGNAAQIEPLAAHRIRKGYDMHRKKVFCL